MLQAVKATGLSGSIESDDNLFGVARFVIHCRGCFAERVERLDYTILRIQTLFRNCMIEQVEGVRSRF